MNTNRDPGPLPDRIVHQIPGGQIPNPHPPVSNIPDGVDHAARGPAGQLEAAPAAPSEVRQRRLRAGTQLSVLCERLDASGTGIARCTDAPLAGWSLRQPLIHVPNLLPNERAHVKIVHVSPHLPAGPEPGPEKGYAFATLMRRYDAAPEREIPACGAFGQCGGCTLQHLSYPAQLRYKGELVRELLAEVLTPAPGQAGSLPSVDVEVAPCVPSAQPLSYRNRVKLVAVRAASEPGSPAAARIILGAYAPRSHRVIDMAGCKVNTPALRALARTLGETWGASGLSVYDEEKGHGALRYVLLREVRSGAMQLSLVVAELPPRAPLLTVVAALRAAHPQLASVVLHHNPYPGNALLARPPAELAAADAEFGAADEALLGPDFLEEDLDAALDLRLRVSARSFLQVNRSVAGRIYSDVAAALPAAAGETILDLYCGVGGLGRTVLAGASHARLLGIETSPSAVADAEHSARAAGLSREQASFLCGPIEDHLPGLWHKDAPRPQTLVLLNPPRRGCTKGVLEAVLGCAPRAIVYVSCNPQSLARDLGVLLCAGYKLTQVTPYDMHPGTPHVETVAILQRAGQGG